MTIREAWVMPFLRILPWVLEHPHGRRFPIPARRRQPGQTNLEVFCDNWRSLCEGYPGLITDDDCKFVEPAFDLLDLKHKGGKS